MSSIHRKSFIRSLLPSPHVPNLSPITSSQLQLVPYFCINIIIVGCTLTHLTIPPVSAPCWHPRPPPPALPSWLLLPHPNAPGCLAGAPTSSWHRCLDCLLQLAAPSYLAAAGLVAILPRAPRPLSPVASGMHLPSVPSTMPPYMPPPSSPSASAPGCLP